MMLAVRAKTRAKTTASTRAEWIERRERGTRATLRVMAFLSFRLGHPVSRILLYGIAAYFFLFAPTVRRRMRQYLRRALRRESTPLDRFRLIISFASTVHDRLYLLNEQYDLFEITIEGLDVVKTRSERGKGAFLMSAHLGSFEVTRAVGRHQPGLKVAMAMYENNARKINSVLAAIDPRLASDIIPLGTLDSMLRIRARLDAGAFVGVLGHRTIGAEQSQCVRFLGATAYFPREAMQAAAILRRPVIFMVGLYRDGTRYHVVFEELADFTRTPRLEREMAVRAAIERYVAALERYRTSDPYNWLNFFDFWQEPAPSRAAARG